MKHVDKSTIRGYVVERGHTYLKKASKYYNIMLTSLSYHLNGRTKSKKMNPQGVLIEQKDEKLPLGFKACKRLVNL